ncbi:hypothetical protein GALL_536110 [mine drainage metagenome]|uniref:Uncharacterized protein n=1 Tax=mine drainage metagenome TaxID=410659 RepID=A0A1J5P163_9ZZZZ
MLHTQPLERPVHPGRSAEIARVAAIGHQHHGSLRIHAQAAHQRDVAGHGQQFAGIVGGPAPCGIGRRHGAGNMARGVGRVGAIGLAQIHHPHPGQLRQQCRRREQGAECATLGAGLRRTGTLAQGPGGQRPAQEEAAPYAGPDGRRTRCGKMAGAGIGCHAGHCGPGRPRWGNTVFAYA